MEKNKVRFITPDYKTLFEVNHGDTVLLDSQPRKVTFIDETHFQLDNSNIWHIREFAIRVNPQGNRVMLDPTQSDAYKAVSDFLDYCEGKIPPEQYEKNTMSEAEKIAIQDEADRELFGSGASYASNSVLSQIKSKGTSSEKKADNKTLDKEVER